MQYRAVGNRCAVNISSLDLPIPDEQAVRLLISKGFKLIEVDIIRSARECVASSKYRRGAKLSEAPGTVDCSSLIKWLYAQRGIWLPRRSIQQSELGQIVQRSNLISGDVVFVSGFINYYLDNPEFCIGHVGIVTDNNTIIHAANREADIIESDICDFVGDKWRIARRYIPLDSKVLTFQTPIEREIEISDDIKWIVLQSI